jgi:hypothetical protein
MNWLNIENREFEGKKWERMGWESKKNFILCGLNLKLKQKWEKENMLQKKKLW